MAQPHARLILDKSHISANDRVNSLIQDKLALSSAYRVKIPARFSGILKTDLKRRQEGDRIKYQIEWQFREILR